MGHLAGKVHGTGLVPDRWWQLCVPCVKSAWAGPRAGGVRGDFVQDKPGVG